MPNLLKNLKINTLGSVDTPANQYSEAVLVKRADGKANTNLIKGLTYPQSGEMQVPLNKRDQGIVNAILSQLTKSLVPAAQEPISKDLRSILHEDMVYDLLWDLNWYFDDAICDIFCDSTITDKKAAVQATLDQYMQYLVAHDAFLDSLQSDAFDPDMDGDDDSTVAGDTDSDFAKRISKKQLNVEDVRTALEKMYTGKTGVPEQVQNVLKGIHPTLLAKATNISNKEDDPMPTTEEILKSYKDLPEEVRKALQDSANIAKQNEDIKKSLETAQAQIEIEKQARLQKEFETRASQLQGLAEDPKEFGTLLKNLHEKAPEDYEKLETLLKKASTAIVEGDLFEEIGKSGNAAPETAWGKIEAAARDIQKRDGGTHAQAISKAMTEQPKLYEEYQKEMNK